MQGHSRRARFNQKATMSFAIIGMGTAVPAHRYALAFVAGFLMLLGARIADGCTSGHGLSGLAQLSVGSTVAVIAMFAGGIVTASLLLRRI